MSEKKGLSRRQFLTGAAVTAAAAAVPVFTNVSTAMAAAPMAPLTKLDPTWTPLDAKALARQGWEIYKGKHSGQSACCEGTFWPVIGALGVKYPATWGTFPKGVFNYGGGGINSWRSICGTPNAGAAVLKLVTNDGKAIDEFMAWYEKTAIPTSACYEDYAAAIANPTDPTRWIPGGSTGGVWGGSGCPIPFVTTPKNACGSVLCHVSLTEWRIAGGTFEATHPGAQSDRCGKVVYDSVFKVATMINSWMAGGTFVGALDAEATTCGEFNSAGAACHGTNGVSGAAGTTYGQPFAQAKMKCSPCHE